VALIDASRAFGARFEIARAEELLEKLVREAGDRPGILVHAGQSYRMIFRPDKAIECFQRALAIKRDLPEALLELAVLYERRHRLSEAQASVEECLRSAPDYLEAALIKARLLRRSRDDAGSENILRALAANEQAHPMVRSQAWADIAQLLDRNADYEGAMSAMLKSKELLLPGEAQFKKESDTVVEILRRIAHEATQDTFQKWSQEARGLPARKVAVLASFPRSGTTLLEQVLDSHPGLVSSDERENFARDIFPAMWAGLTNREPTLALMGSVPISRLASLREKYLSSMASALNEPIGDRVHLDKNPSLTLMIPAFLRLFPEGRLIIALRDPRDVILSCFMQFLPLNTNSVCFLSLERAATRYAVDMGVWLQLRDKLSANWLEVRYEDAIENLEKEARRGLGFLGLDWDASVMGYRKRVAQKAVSSPTYEAVSKPLYKSSIGRWHHYERHFAPVLEKLKPFARAFGYESP